MLGGTRRQQKQNKSEFQNGEKKTSLNFNETLPRDL